MSFLHIRLYLRMRKVSIFIEYFCIAQTRSQYLAGNNTALLENRSPYALREKNDEKNQRLKAHANQAFGYSSHPSGLQVCFGLILSPWQSTILHCSLNGIHSFIPRHPITFHASVDHSQAAICGFFDFLNRRQF